MYKFRRKHLHDIFRYVGIGAVILLGLAVVGHFLGQYIPFMEQWIAHLGIFGPIVFVGIYSVLTAIFFPSNVLGLAAGAMFEFWHGIIVMAFATVAGSIVMFVVARWIMKKRVEKMLGAHPKLLAVDEAVSQEGFKLMFLLRLSPIPFAPLSYVLGSSKVRFIPYLLASVGMFLSNISIVYYGYVAKHVMKLTGHTEDFPIGHYVGLFIGLVVAIGTTVYVSFVVRRELKRYLPEDVTKQGSSRSSKKDRQDQTIASGHKAARQKRPKPRPSEDFGGDARPV